MLRRFSLQTLLSVASVLAILSTTTLAQQARTTTGSPSTDSRRISASELTALLDRDAAIVVDVRDPEMFRRGHLPGARLAPPELWREVGLELKSATKAIVTYCSCPQEESSMRAAARFRELGVQNVRALTGGYEGWADSGRPVVRPQNERTDTPATAAPPQQQQQRQRQQQQPQQQQQTGNNESSRESWQRVPDVIAALGIAPGSRVADVGAGDGFFTTRLAKAVGADGRVYAVDISKNALDRLTRRVADAELTNVETILSTPADPRLPPGTLDAALIVNAYHEMREHQAMLAAIKAALKPGGRLVILESVINGQRNLAREVQENRHQLAPHFVQQDALQAGFAIVRFDEAFARPGTMSPEYLLVLTPIGPTVEAPPEPVHDHTTDDVWRKPDDVVAALQLRPGMTVIDLGAGSGVFTRRFARAIGPTGRAIGLDISPGSIDALKKDAASLALTTYEARLVKADDPALPAASADVIFLSNTYHHIENRVPYFTRLRSALKPGGRLVIVDFNAGQMAMDIPDRKQVEAELSVAGYQLSRAHEFLSRQFFLEFVVR
jgi:ubiquinone/menaquinone biosynthesis C-methylase UbiE/rhodanese-related sulfurtransferase